MATPKQRQDNNEKGKETPKKPFSHAVKVSKHRADKNRLKISGILKIEDGCRIWGEKGFKKTDHAPINLNLVLSEDDLHRLLSYASNQDSNFISQFSLILAEAIQRTRIGARGKYKGKETTIFWIKVQAACLYIFFSYWCKRKVDDWTEYLKGLLTTAKRDGYEDYLKTMKGRYSAQGLAAYCLEEYYKDTLETYSLRPFDDPANFYITYIQPSLKLAREIMKEVNYNDTESIINSPVGTIFKSLKII